MKSDCSIGTCTDPALARGFCGAHYARWRRGADMEAPLKTKVGVQWQFLVDVYTLPRAHDGWPHSHLPSGYGTVYDPKLKKNQYIHVVSCTLAHGPKPDGLEVLHSCRVKDCFWAEHLEWGTHAQNLEDKRRDGTIWRSTVHPRAKLSESDVRMIRQRYAAGGVSTRGLAKQYGLSGSYVSAIIRREKWAWLI